MHFFSLLLFPFFSPRSSLRLSACLRGRRCWQMHSKNTSKRSCLTFLKTTASIRTKSSLRCSAAKTSALETHCTLPKNSSGVSEHNNCGVLSELSSQAENWRNFYLCTTDGHFNPEVVKYRQLCLKSQYKRYLSSQQQYFYRLLKQILASRNVSVIRVQPSLSCAL